MEANKQLLKSLAQGSTSGASKPNALTKMRDQMMKQLKAVKGKQVADIAMFTVGIVVMYKFGRALAEVIDNQMPSEKSMMEMMRSYGGAPGMPPPPM